MKSSFYSGMLNDLSKVRMSDFERARAELQMRRAAAMVDMVLGAREAADADEAQAPAARAKAEEYRAAA